jgi:hypothetical protein
MIPTVHRLPALALLAAAGSLLAGCGSSTSSPYTTKSGHSSQLAFSAYARAVNLRPGDLPGGEPGSTEHEERETGKANSPLARCIGAPERPHDVLRVSSPTLGDPKALNAASSVSTDQLAPKDPNAFAARREVDLKLYRSSRAAGCNANALLEKLRGQGLQHATVTSLANPLSGHDGAIAYRVLIKGDLPPTNGVSRAIQLYVDVVLLFDGRAAIELEVGNIPGPPPPATEQGLVKLLSSRAAAHSF